MGKQSFEAGLNGMMVRYDSQGLIDDEFDPNLEEHLLEALGIDQLSPISAPFSPD